MLRRLLLLVMIVVGSPVWAAYDTTAYREYTYGRSPDRYCDPTKSLSDNTGDGLTEDSAAWNMNQCMTQPSVSGFASPGIIVGIMPVGAGTPVRIADPADHATPAFNPTNEGTSDTARIIYVAKYGAIALAMADRAGIASNTLRAEIRFTTTTDQVEYGASPTGPVYGSFQRDYITYDGLFVDMAQNGFHNDSGVIRADGGSTSTYVVGVQFLNFVIKGKTLDCDSNCVIWRPNFATDTVLRNFLAYDFINVPTSGGGADLNQDGLFSDQYSDHNFLIEYFWLDNVGQAGLFVKGSTDGLHNWGTIRYGIVSRTSRCIMVNDLHGTTVTEIHHNLCYLNGYDGAGGGIEFHAITSATGAVSVHHNTIARVATNTADIEGCIFNDKPLGFSASTITIQDNICDLDSGGSWGHQISICCSATAPTTLDYNAYYENGGTRTWTFDSVEYNDFTTWKAAIGRDANSILLSTTPFVDRANNDFTISPGHAVLTASSTGGELGAYEGSIDPGPDTTAASGSGGARFGLWNLRR